MKIKAVNAPMYHLRMGLAQRDLNKVQENGPLLAAQLSDLEQAPGAAQNPHVQSFLREGRALLDKYAVELPLLQRGDQVKKAILKIKSQGSWFKLEGALAQGDAQAVKSYGDSFENEIRTFTQQYGGEALAGSFLDEAQKLLGRLHQEGDGIIRASRVREEIAKIRQQDDMTRLSMALNVRDGPKISQHGAAFKAQIQRFKQAYANEPAARVFLNESEALLSRYEREAPSILREDEVKKAIANLRLKSELMAVQNAVHAQNCDVLASKGPAFEEQMNQFLSKYNTDPVYSTLIPPSFIEQLSDIASRYYKLMNIPRAFNARPSAGSAVFHQGNFAGTVKITSTGPDGSKVEHVPWRPASLFTFPGPTLPPPPVSHDQIFAGQRDLGLKAAQEAFARSDALMSSLQQSGPSSPLFPSGGPGGVLSTFSPYINATSTPDINSWITCHTSDNQQPPLATTSGYTNTASPMASRALEQLQSRFQSRSPPSPSPSPSSPSLSGNSAGYTNTSPSSSSSPATAMNFSAGYVDSVSSSPVAVQVERAGQKASCPINPAYAPTPKEAMSVTVTSSMRSSSGGVTEQEKLSIEETKATMKFREIMFNEFQILEKLGSGQLGTVYLARWRGALVAVKKLDEDDMDEKTVDLFKKEAAALHVLSHHPSLASFIGACCVLPNVCIVTQYYRYGSLEGALRGKTRLDLTWKQVIKIAMEAAAGILHLHKEGVLHSRISSRNILLGDGVRAYVNDFAFCHMKTKESVYTHTAGTSSFIGPVRYMSPDAMMHKYSEGSDAWSFGVLLWELWERREPFEGDDDLTVAFRVSQDQQTLPISPACPLVLATLMKQCWLDRPSQRPSFSTIHETLQTYYKSL